MGRDGFLNERVLFAYGIHTGTLRKSDSCRNLCVEEQPNVRSGGHMGGHYRLAVIRYIPQVPTVVPEQDEEVRYRYRYLHVGRYLRPGTVLTCFRSGTCM